MSEIVLNNDKKENVESIKKDENGYYDINLGAINTYNHNGIYYRVNDLDALIDGEKSVLKRRLSTGVLRAEYKHPDFSNIKTQAELINKVMTINLDRVCAHIKEVRFINRGYCEKGWDGLYVHDVIGKVKPTGPYAQYLQEALDNPDENVCFSIRSLVEQNTIGGIVVRDIVDISTWDYVHEPGIKTATQWHRTKAIENLFIDENISVCINGVCNNAIANSCSSGTMNYSPADSSTYYKWSCL